MRGITGQVAMLDFTANEATLDVESQRGVTRHLSPQIPLRLDRTKLLENDIRTEKRCPAGLGMG